MLLDLALHAVGLAHHQRGQTVNTTHSTNSRIASRQLM
jgi:hypothetical protein